LHVLQHPSDNTNGCCVAGMIRERALVLGVPDVPAAATPG
jgi:hypothetical protein